MYAFAPVTGIGADSVYCNDIDGRQSAPVTQYLGARGGGIVLPPHLVHLCTSRWKRLF